MNLCYTLENNPYPASDTSVFRAFCHWCHIQCMREHRHTFFSDARRYYRCNSNQAYNPSHHWEHQILVKEWYSRLDYHERARLHHTPRWLVPA